MDKKPKVIPTKDQMASANSERAKKEAFEAEKLLATNEIYLGPTKLADTPIGHADALAMMQERTANQLKQKEIYGTVAQPDLAETTAASTRRFVEQKSQDQIALRDEQLKMNIEQTKNYQRLSEEAMNRKQIKDFYPGTNQNNLDDNWETRNKEVNKYKQENMTTNQSYEQGYTPRPVPTQQPINQPTPVAPVSNSVNPYLLEISQPNYNSPFDVIPLPSEGKTYKTKKANIRLSYMTTADENILTSPNLLQSGEFLSILINRKILESELRYKDLLVGDRSAIMIWLRATGYGEMYPVTLFDEDGMAFDTELNLNELKTKKLGAEPDEEGLFDYNFKLSQTSVKFKLLTCGDVDELEKLLMWEKENNVLVNNASTYSLEKMIVEVNGSRDRNMIKDFVSSIRIKDGKDFTKYVESIEPGIDLNITVGTPGGGSVDTFLPLNTQFFWPDFGV
jgi:hypothetical protein